MYYTEEEIRRANEASILNYLIVNNYKLIKRSRNSISLLEHDSLVISPDKNKWYWFSRGIGGIGCLDFVKKYELISFKEAMKKILGIKQSLIVTFKRYKANASDNEELKLPKRVDDQSKIYNYLCKERKINADIVTRMINEKKLYQDARGNCVFVGCALEGKPKYALKIGTNINHKFKREVLNSRKKYGLELISNKVYDTVYVFESIIDAMSYETIERMRNKTVNFNMIVLSGVCDLKLDKYLEGKSNIKKIVMMLDNDIAGRKNSSRLGNKYKNLGYAAFQKICSNKDWNEKLVMLY